MSFDGVVTMTTSLSGTTAQVPTILIVHQSIGLSGKAVQTDSPVPLRRVERVKKAAAFPDRVRFRPIESDVVQAAQVLAARKHFLFVDVDPLLEVALARGS